MAVTSAQFLIEHSEFTEIALALVQAKLDRAELANDEGAWGVLYDQAVYLYAADSLNDAPYGSNMGSENVTKDRSKYGMAYDRLLLRISRRGQITGGGLT